MNELTIEQKAQRYDEALKRLEDIKTGKCQKAFVFTEGLFDYLFPELKESGGGERIRKNLIELFHDTVSNDEIFSDYGLDKTEVLAWLEKQKTSEEALQYLKENHSPS